MRIQRITAIFEKDIKDFMKNIMLLMMPIIPVMLALVYNRISDEELPIAMIYIIVGVTFSAVTSTMMMTMMAEENERKTLRGLVQSPASMLDIIIGKSLVTGLITFVALIVSLMIIDIDPFLNLKAILGLILLFLFFLFLGIGVGLFAKSISSTSFYMMPIMILFGFTPMFWMLGLGEENIAIRIAEAFPIMQGIKIHETTSWFPLGVIAVWVIAAAVFMYLCFKKTMTDD